MANLMTSVGTVFTSMIEWAGVVGTTIVGSDVLTLFCVAIPVCGIGIGCFRRLLSARG